MGPLPLNSGLSHPEIRDLLELCPATQAFELQSLAQESDAQLYAEGLLNFATRQEQAGRLELAARIYQNILSGEVAGRHDRAQSRLDAIVGRGAFGNRAEFLLRNLAAQASEPSALLAMGAAGTVFRLTRLATLSRLTAAANPGFLTQVIGAGRVASLLGFALEAPTFTLASRLGNEALGRNQDWSTRALGRDLASSYLVLGGLKFSGMLGRAATARLGNMQPLSTLVQQGSQLGGILLGHRLETWSGLRPAQEGATTLVDSLAMLLQFHVAGNLSRTALGPHFSAWEAGLEQRAAAMEGLARPIFAMSSRPGLAMEIAGPAESSNNGDRLAEIIARPHQSERLIDPSETLPTEEAIPEVRANANGRAKPVDHGVITTIKVVQAQGVAWVIDIDTDERNRSLEVEVGGHLLPQGGSLRVRDGQIIRMGERRYRFRDAVSPEVSETAVPKRVSVARTLHPNYGMGGSADFSLHLGPFLDAIEQGEEIALAEGPHGPVRLRMQSRYAITKGTGMEVLLRDARHSLRLQMQLGPDRVIFHNPPVPRDGQSHWPIFLDWIVTQAAIRAAELEFRNTPTELVDYLSYGLVNSAYDRFEAGRDGLRYFTQPRSLILPPEFGSFHRVHAERAFQDWAERRLGRRIPTLLEIEEGHPLPSFNRLGVEASMHGILERLVSPNSRFLEIGFGARTETLEAVERRGGVAWGLELNRVYPAGADRRELQSSPVDVLFVNGSPFLFYTQHQVALPAALDIIQQFPRAEWLVLQAYNPRTPFEILRHAEELNRRSWEPMYFRSAASLDEAPLFPTDWCQRPDTAHAVLIARRGLPKP